MTSPPTRPDLGAIRSTLIDDVAECWIASREAGAQQVDRRNYVRAVFAMIDGFLAVLKAYVIDEWDAGRFNPSRAEAAALLEETYDITDAGDARARPRFPPWKSNLLFTFDIFARAHDVAEKPDYDDAGWESLKAALRIRHRVTHPKATTDLSISDEELDVMGKAFAWFLDATFVVYVPGRANVLAKIRAAETEIGKLRAIWPGGG